MRTSESEFSTINQQAMASNDSLTMNRFKPTTSGVRGVLTRIICIYIYFFKSGNDILKVLDGVQENPL